MSIFDAAKAIRDSRETGSHGRDGVTIFPTRDGNSIIIELGEDAIMMTIEQAEWLRDVLTGEIGQ